MEKHEYDALIVQLLKEGDPRVMDLLYDKYEEMVKKTAYKILLSRERAEDAKQEVFARIYDLLLDKKSLTVTGEVGGFLHTMTKNLCLNQERSEEKYKLRNFLYSENIPQVIMPVDDTDKERIMQVDKVLEGQSPERRLAYQLVVREEKTYEEAAKITGTSKHTIKILVYRTIKEIKSKLGKKFPLL